MYCSSGPAKVFLARPLKPDTSPPARRGDRGLCLKPWGTADDSMYPVVDSNDGPMYSGPDGGLKYSGLMHTGRPDTEESIPKEKSPKSLTHLISGFVPPFNNSKSKSASAS